MHISQCTARSRNYLQLSRVQERQLQRMNSPLGKPDNSMVYNMNYKQKGLCLILCMETFHKDLKEKGVGARNSKNDKEELKSIFKEMGFEVRLEENKTAHDIEKLLTDIAKEDHSGRGCFACVVMSHGDEDFFYASDQEYKIDALAEPFRGEECKSLFGKPKLFFIQACRGTKADSGVVKDAGCATTTAYKIPTECDFLYSYATPLGYFAWKRDGESWFIQSLCKMLKENWQKRDLLQILTRVNNKVAYDYESDSKTMNGKKQMPCFLSLLTKELYFFHKTDQD
ncbi:caspase-3 isoform X2 [Xenopus laevis]|uniref:Caspase-3 isoform X2 n=1 Tax=Xenopus laevis TaxID=8355 RepID=A0A8J1MUH3_XENLA|nr:caspase-3 isoform X2 [Xenopus laevis]